MGRLERALLIGQGLSYLSFSLWALTRRQHYREVHRLQANDWILNAHAMWMGLVGTVLATSGLRKVPTAGARFLGPAAAAALGANDAWLWKELPDIYHGDLAFESGLLGLWVVVLTRNAETARR